MYAYYPAHVYAIMAWPPYTHVDLYICMYILTLKAVAMSHAIA